MKELRRWEGILKLMNRNWKILLIALAAVGLWLAAGLSWQWLLRWEETPGWREVAPGMVAARCWTHGVLGEHLAAVRIDPARCDITVHTTGRDGALAETICPPVGAAINASYFSDDRSPIGLLMVDRRLLQRHFPVHEWGTFEIRDGRPELVKSTSTLAPGVTEAFECKPRLIVGGQIQTFKPQAPAPRSAVGMDARGRVLFVATDESDLSLAQWAACLRAQFGCVDALNLDGGPSAQLAVRGRVQLLVRGGWTVPVFITAAPRRPAR